jgi:hypothetical protein
VFNHLCPTRFETASDIATVFEPSRVVTKRAGHGVRNVILVVRILVRNENRGSGDKSSFHSQT